jgi:FkbM family methyltransferase
VEFFHRGLLRSESRPCEVAFLDGFELYASPDDVAVGKHVIAQGDYESNVSGLFRTIVKPGMHVLDIGANIGFYTLLAASLVGETGKVWAVEPNPENVRMILASRGRNHFENVYVLQAAASDRWQTMSIFPDASNAMVQTVNANHPSQIPLTVQSLPLDSWLGDTTIDVVKLDVDGAEGVALVGMKQLIRRCHPTIFCELTPGALPPISGMSAEQFLELLVNFGYEISVLLDTLVWCGSNVQLVMEHFRDSGLAYVDLLASYGPAVRSY